MKKVRDLKRAYEKAVREGRETFTINDFEFYTPFAKYLIEYLEMKGIPDDMPLEAILEKRENK